MSSVPQGLTPRQKSWAGAVAIAVVSLAAGYGLSQSGDSEAGAPGDDGAEECEEVLYWYDPMVPDQHFDEPGPSPFMDMALVPRCADEAAGAAGVRVNPDLAQSFSIRTTEAEFGMLEPDVTVTGTLDYNRSDIAIVQPRAGGFVERTFGQAPQDVVSRGAPLAEILVPEWGGAQREYLAVLKTGDEALASAARERLMLLGMSPSLIAELTRRRQPQPTITVTAPISGAITELFVRPGMTVAAGQTLAQIAGFTPVWLEAAVPERLLADVSVGQPVAATLNAYPEERFTGSIIAILPSADEESRTITVRAALPNPDRRLKPGMFARVDLAPQRRRALLIPSEAVIRTGERTIVMLAQKEGGYRPAEVRVGREANGRTEVLAGLAPSEEVVTSGQFLLDSEASLTGLDVRPVGGADRDNTEDENEPEYEAKGTVAKIGTRSITLQHGPVPELEWPAMTMAFATTGPPQVQGLEPGDQVIFSFVQADTGPRIASIRRTGR